MKCPFREIRETQTINCMGEKVVVKTDFAECYYGECPYYVPEQRCDPYIIQEYCKRCCEQKS